ncbi:Tn7-like element transposition protein TnsE [Schinkia azotoformans]|uniref:Tn7-like element transposition protein TnsE n=1 Tax=Schinkia azotoformans TaxID=1454 RepID=UPI002DBCF6F4|nr:Tn7-like element transposition protein TnsE [Schinkia azotoformans]MEC1722662.1 Tn7-like element transposition protein TnsE [Schinkia azotoformans]MED4415858.1 Tn7-like element transposition protein TnsE [Schinkia azotoformans]
MSKQQVKLNNWPFKNGEQAQLTWISSPFLQEKKIMIYAYFRFKGRTEKLIADWGTLPALAIQHYYLNGDISKSVAPVGTDEVEITICPNDVTYSEREWSIYGTNDKDKSRSFIVSYKNKKYILPLIEVVRSILAPNRFLLYRLFETNSFPQYFIEQHEANKIHLDFSSLYHRKYTQDNYLYQLVWLLSNQDLRRVFENVAYTFVNTGILKFDWLITQPIAIKAIIKPSSTGGTILKITNVKKKNIPYTEISFTHPEIIQTEKSGEAKKYTLHSKNGNGGQQSDLTLDEEVDGTTDNFDLIEMDNQIHEYVKLPKVTKIRRNSNKQRDFEDENTKKYFIDDQGKRATSDVGGSKVAKGLENKSLYDIQVKGELGDFIKVLKSLENYPEVQSINVIQGSLKEFSDAKRCVYLSDGVMERKYVIAEIKLFPNKVASVVEVEREDRALSTLLVRLEKSQIKVDIYQRNFSRLLNNNGTWDKEFLYFNQIKFITMKHGRKNIDYRARRLYLKLFEV